MKKDFTKLVLTGIFISLCHLWVFAKTESDGYEINIKLEDYAKDTLLLAYQLGNQTYIRDTAILDKTSGFFTFKGSEKLKAGIYMVAMPPDMYFQFVVSEQAQNFTLVTTMQEPYNKAALKNSTDNDLYFGYMRYLNDKSKLAEEATALRTKDSVKATRILIDLDKEVKAFQKELISKHKGTVTAMVLKTAIDIDTPNFDHIKDKNERELAMYYYYKEHWFDNFEKNNQAVLRLPLLFNRIEYYIEKLTPQHPDSVIQSLDRVLALVKPSNDAFRFYFLHYFNIYVKTKLVGFDGIYVHLTKKYMETGQCDYFLDKDNKAKIIAHANKIAPTLIGQKAPEITVFLQDTAFTKNSKPVSLYAVKAKYTVLFFYLHDCGHCQKQSPDLVEFYNKAKAKNIDIQVFTVCTTLNINDNKMPLCMKYVQEKGFGGFINTMDPYLMSRYKQLYNVEMTPQLFVLDENKIIRSKSIEAKQLEEVLDYIIQEDNMKLKKQLLKD